MASPPLCPLRDVPTAAPPGLHQSFQGFEGACAWTRTEVASPRDAVGWGHRHGGEGKQRGVRRGPADDTQRCSSDHKHYQATRTAQPTQTDHAARTVEPHDEVKAVPPAGNRRGTCKEARQFQDDVRSGGKERKDVAHNIHDVIGHAAQVPVRAVARRGRRRRRWPSLTSHGQVRRRTMTGVQRVPVPLSPI
jgi:hypothetical protein